MWESLSNWWDSWSFGDLFSGAQSPEGSTPGFGEWDRLPPDLGDFGGFGGSPVLSDTPGGGTMMPGGGEVVPAAFPLAGLFGIGGAARAASIMIRGARVPVSRVWAAVRANPLALNAIAAAAGMSVGALASILMTHQARRRPRRRGISSRDVRTTRRVVGFVCRLNDQLASLRCAPAPMYHRRRRAACR